MRPWPEYIVYAESENCQTIFAALEAVQGAAPDSPLPHVDVEAIFIAFLQDVDTLKSVLCTVSAFEQILRRRLINDYEKDAE
jgi:hypothetical protein